jgi:hypothetical protein
LIKLFLIQKVLGYQCCCHGSLLAKNFEQDFTYTATAPKQSIRLNESVELPPAPGVVVVGAA